MKRQRLDQNVLRGMHRGMLMYIVLPQLLDPVRFRRVSRMWFQAKGVGSG